MSTEITTTNNEIENVKKSKNFLKRTKTSLLIIISLIPIFFLATIYIYVQEKPYVNTIFGLYILLFQTLLGLAMVYGIYEITNLIKPRKSNKKEWMQLFIPLVVIFSSLCLFGIIHNIVAIFNVKFLTIFEIFYKKENLWLWMMLMIVIFLAITSMTTLKLRDIILPTIVSLLLYLYISNLTVMTVEWGWQTVGLFVLVICTSDVMAYIGGKKYGEKKIFPKVSPNKTVEGFVIGIVSSITIGIIFFMFVFIGLNHFGFLAGEISKTPKKYWLILILIFTSLIAPFGDLFFSKIKREYDAKDYANILPGHGGLLDRLDSHIFGVIVASFLINILIEPTPLFNIT